MLGHWNSSIIHFFVHYKLLSDLRVLPLSLKVELNHLCTCWQQFHWREADLSMKLASSNPLTMPQTMKLLSTMERCPFPHPNCKIIFQIKCWNRIWVRMWRHPTWNANSACNSVLHGVTTCSIKVDISIQEIIGNRGDIHQFNQLKVTCDIVYWGQVGIVVDVLLTSEYPHTPNPNTTEKFQECSHLIKTINKLFN